MALGSRWLGKGCACARPSEVLGAAWRGKALRCFLQEAGAPGLLAFSDLCATKKGTRCETPCETLSAVPAASLWFWLMAFVSGVFGRHCKGKAFVQPTSLVLHCQYGERCLCKCSSPAWRQSLNNWLLELPPKTAKGHGRAGEASWQRLHSGCLEALLQGAANLAGRRKQMWLHLKAVDFNRVAQDS
ncbi:uncharacterized protein LOC142414806 isoform X2 [Mycteria americana]|uniref:uncharacterized protein LOC142414806 isoform X2 n=1 Tax=Mycteria americana TaxID=33587 RepID=UPI003F5876EF